MLMDDSMKIIFGVGLLFVFVGVLNRRGGGSVGRSKENKPLSYKHKDFLMTHAEHNFFKKLELAVGDLYYIFPQIHLSSIVNHSVVGQNWKILVLQIYH